ncbi:MAG: MFS transporter [Clostridiales Family XIII bacterium]|jgi:predicted MFS family arabinose efflux permease|nr:MFS transporter [Clostridiales Family XIII bacterium]
MKETDRPKQRSSAKLWTKNFIILNFVNVFYSFGFSMMMPLMALFIVYLGGDSRDVGLTATSFAVAAIVSRFFSPLIMERVRNKSLLAAGTVLSMLIMIGLALTPVISGVLVLRTVMGIAFGFVSALTTKLAADTLPDSRRGEGIGYFGMGNALMAALSPVYGIFAAEALGFKITFLTAAVFHLISAAGVLALGRTDAHDPSATIPAKKETGAREPFTGKVFDKALILPMILLVYFGFFRSSELSYLPLLAKARRIPHFSVYYLVQTAASVLSRMLIGSLYDRRGPAWVMIPGGIFALAAYFTFSVASSLPVLLLAGVFNGVVLGTLQAGLQSWAIDLVPANKRGIASAAYFNYYDIGLAAGASVFGHVAANYGYPLIYRLACIPAALFLVTFVCVYFAAARKKKTRDESGNEID